MRCARCGNANEEGRKFCRECGARQGVLCAGCGTVEPGDSKFCGECGAALAGGAQPANADGSSATADAPRPIPLSGQERRLISVLFADLVGFTVLAEGRDPEAVRDVLSEYYDLARERVRWYGGTIEKFIGDAVMAVWGAPTAHEDDAERAVRCALDLVGMVQELGPRVGVPELRLRAAVHTGEAAVTLEDGAMLVAGDLVNTASRLQSVAPPGGVLVGESTQRAAGRAIGFRRIADLSLKGKSLPVPAWQATEVLARRGGAGRSEALEPPFVGRDDQLRLLKELYHATVREGRARLVSVTGQAGIGKSRLAWELEKYVSGLAEPTRWFHGRSPASDQGVSYWALGEMVRQAAGIAETDDEGVSRARLSRLLENEIPDDADRRWIAQRLAALLGIEETPTGDRAELFAAWRAFFEHAASRGPAVLVFEDLQWADTGMIDFVESMLEWSRGHPFLIVTLARPEMLERRPTWGAGQRSFTSLHLEPLPAAAMEQLLAGLAPGLPDGLVRRVLERAEGVPLYAVETVRMLIDRGIMEAGPDGYRPTGPVEQLALPETLHALIAARLDSLDGEARRIVQHASVLGQTFTVAALSAVTGAAESDLVQKLDGLVRREIMRLDADPRSPERGQYGFLQAAIREVAYASLARADRRTDHVAAAAFFESLGDEEIAGVVATHYLAAFHATPQGAEADVLREHARRTLMNAADRARGLHSYDQARAYLDLALEVAVTPEERARLWELAGDASRALGDHASAERYLGDAIAWYRAQGDREQMARATAALTTVLIDGVKVKQAIELLLATLEELKEVEPDPHIVRLMANLSRAYMNTDWESAVHWADRAIVAGERLDDIPSVVEALINRGSAIESLGRPREAQAILRGALALAERQGLTVSALRAATNLATLESQDAPRAAFEAFESGIETARRAGEMEYVSRLTFAMLEQWNTLGDWDRLFDFVAALDDGGLLAHEWEHLRDILAVVAAYRGDTDASHGYLAAWVTEPERTLTMHEGAHHFALGTVALAEGRFADAHREAIGAAAASPTLAEDASYLAGRAALWSRDAIALREAVAAYEALEHHSLIYRAKGTVLRAATSLVDGRVDEGATAHRDAVEQWRALEIPLEVGLALLEWATFGPAGPATESARAEALETLGRLGAGGIVDRWAPARDYTTISS